MLDGGLSASLHQSSPLEDITIPDIIHSRMQSVGAGIENSRRAISM
jgi:hypothetical protein